MKVARVVLSWPPRILNPNVHMHWKHKHRAAKAYKQEAFILAKATAHDDFNPDRTVNVSVVFYPPDRRRRDGDNLLGAMKHAFDGMAAAWGVDDVKFCISYAIGEQVRRGGVSIFASQP